MKFESNLNPSDERGILILCTGGDHTYMVQGQFYEEEDDYYDWDGELIEGFMGWAELPEIEW